MEIIDLLGVGLDALSTAVELGEAISKFSPHRKCELHITNVSKSRVLQNPKMYVCKGTCVDPPSPTILYSSSGNAVFAKTPFTGQGFSGICTYDLLDDSTQKATQRLAIFFKVRYNLNMNSNQYAVGVFDANREGEKSLFDEMSKNMGLKFIKSQAGNSPLTYISQNVRIKAAMSNNYAAVVKVHLSDGTLKSSTI